ncbi:hypothetical protein DPMN_132667 [Dreissena polymorpha]|uniref:Uncharacterized protein n=1 Tax=Dreissena polymorpha TaxID=45954 RepID=A0A9D4JE21_DREPO|nr:hypothetical protein DPMN_132667 [Dreissena polymorpha]
MTATPDGIEDQSPDMQDVLSESHLHLPGFEEVVAFAVSLVKLVDNTDQHVVPPELRQPILKAA